MTSDIRLAQLLSSRICHDLVGPAGALGNGIELLKEVGNDAEVIELIIASAGRLMRQLDFFRLAFGLRGGVDTIVGWDEANRLAAGLIENSAITFDWKSGNQDSGDEIAGSGTGSGNAAPSAVVRLVLCLVLVAVGALPRRGVVGVRVNSTGDAHANGGFDVSVSAKGERLSLDEDVATSLTTPIDVGDLTARNAHAYFAACLARSLDSVIGVTRGEEDALVFSVHVSGAH
ncbi:MAG: hypothetical protein KIT00_11970 [Rhodospirillales bacterium]|nr:hypothetical protein [Rhodospirillales bacterium]